MSAKNTPQSVKVKASEHTEPTDSCDVEVNVPGLIHYDHGPNLAEALARLAYRVAKFHKLDAPSLKFNPVARPQVVEDLPAKHGAEEVKLQPYSRGWNGYADAAKPIFAALRAENERLLSGFWQPVIDEDLQKISDFVGDGELPSKSFFMRPDAAYLANATMHMVREVQASRVQSSEMLGLLQRLKNGETPADCGAEIDAALAKYRKGSIKP